jgi:hypothetical protein
VLSKNDLASIELDASRRVVQQAPGFSWALQQLRERMRRRRGQSFESPIWLIVNHFSALLSVSWHPGSYCSHPTVAGEPHIPAGEKTLCVDGLPRRPAQAAQHPGLHSILAGQNGAVSPFTRPFSL